MQNKELVFLRCKLESKMKLFNYNQQSFAKALGMSVATLNRKLQGYSEFDRAEMDTIRRLLHLSTEEFESIFFAETVA